MAVCGSVEHSIVMSLARWIYIVCSCVYFNFHTKFQNPNAMDDCQFTVLRYVALRRGIKTKSNFVRSETRQ